ncbi:putative nucleic acid binding protein [Trypanosoma rangeli]|uniref:Putative nucleic acid binding protein n=1 Tax=Trypanosoma rangeli TaxID=5698 RepID=A0A422MYR6_TRYRA|nr:putative nucleic acid binding protein [Trypanosoma rangeli]RNE98368.1 putative nucleic acid binding protein [Trypanosoma rangeli]|eukprot:RNE98368.1 putative nucleic acid binding protein [Trypanosoma rangeli]
MRAGRYDVGPTPPAGGDDLVTCSIHSSRRLAKFCLCRPVYNADRVLVGYTYECKEGMQCAASVSRNSFVQRHQIKDPIEGHDGALPTPLVTSMAPALATAADIATAPEKEAAPQQPRAGAARDPNRYYDLTNQRDSGATGVKKVCWNCGMEGHEKPECRNSLCKTCHTLRGYHHLCQEPRPSPFLIVSPALLLSEDMSSVRCVSCSSLGHFDCSPCREPRLSSCCFCGERGHNAYDCRRRKEQVPDRWVTRTKEAEYGMRFGENGGVFPLAPSVSTTFATANTPPSHTQGYAWRGRGTPSRGGAWNADMKANEFYAKGGNTGGNCARNAHPYNDRKAYAGYNESSYNAARTGADYYSQYGKKRSRSDDEASRRNHHYHNNNRTPKHYRDADWEHEGNQRMGRNYTYGGGGDARQHAHQLYHNNDRYPQRRRRRNRGGGDSDDDCDNLF